jgi:hypothetical protein
LPPPGCAAAVHRQAASIGQHGGILGAERRGTSRSPATVDLSTRIIRMPRVFAPQGRCCAGFELTDDLPRACELRDAACERLLPELPIPRLTLEELNDTSIGHVTVLRVFDAYLQLG